MPSIGGIRCSWSARPPASSCTRAISTSSAAPPSPAPREARSRMPAVTKEPSVTINWAQCHTRPVLMIPGPTELPFPVIQAMNQPPAIQYDRSFDEQILEPTTLALRDVFQTKNEVIMMPGSGRTALEAGALSVIEPRDRVLVVGAGQFGVLMREIMNRIDADWTEFPVEWGARLDLTRLEREAERIRPKALTLVHNETSTGTTYPAAEVAKIARGRRALPARHRLLDRGDRRAHGRVGRGPEHDRLAEVPRRAARYGPRRREPASVGGHGAPEQAGTELRVRPPALEGVVGPGVARRQGAGRRAAAPARVHAHASHRGHERRREADPRGGARPSLPPPRGGRHGAPAWPRGDGHRDVPRPFDRVEHGLVPEGAQVHRARRRRRSDARPLRDPDRHGPRQDAHDDAPHRDHGPHGEPAVRAADALGARAGAARPRVQVRARRRRRRRASRVRRRGVTPRARAARRRPRRLSKRLRGHAGPRALEEAR